MHLIIRLVIIPLLRTRIPPNRTDINHAIAKLHKRAPHHGQLQIRNVVQDEPHQLLVPGFADVGDEGVRGHLDAELVGCEAVLGEAEIEHVRDGRLGGVAELFLLFYEVGAADEADGYFLAEGGEEGGHFWGYIL